MAIEPEACSGSAATLFAASAAAAVEAVIAGGAEQLIAEPWRAGRIIRGAEALTLDQLRTEVARRLSLAPPPDFNRALALAQLARVLAQSRFASAWASWRATRTSGPRGISSGATA